MQPEHLFDSALKIEGVQYFTAAQVADAANVSRQTLWRWRKEGKVPSGQRYRDRQILFTAEDVASVLEYANRLEPATAPVRKAQQQGGEA